ncbi:MAG: patatin [Sulfobacillus thermosulfidooxidans]|uniref:Patatin n=1 Tax=Sulfobacillus thermosulfidooxidans TaxID=28034 RepID=A0A2T2WS31_SULTH|nr:MAG: patatin [Sulfobacillus thermosulfidooxidans]
MFTLALSGGGLLGAAHLGVLEVLAEKGVKPIAVAGTSAGGLVASLVAAQVPVSTMIAWAKDVTSHPWDFFDLNIKGLVEEIWPDDHEPATGLVNPEKFLKSLIRLAPGINTISDWKLPCTIISVDIATMVPVAFSPVPGLQSPEPGWQIIFQADLLWALNATMAMPGLFDAVRRGTHLYVDGGIANTLPSDWAYQLSPSPVLAVNVAPTTVVNGEHMGIADILSRSESFVTQYLSNVENRGYPVLTISPPTEGTPFFGFHDYDHLVEIGRQTALNAWPQIEAFISTPFPKS